MTKKILLIGLGILITSCQSEKDKLINSKLSAIEAELELIELTEADFDRETELVMKDINYKYTDEELQFMAGFEYKVDRHTQLTEQREYWILQK